MDKQKRKKKRKEKKKKITHNALLKIIHVDILVCLFLFL